MKARVFISCGQHKNTDEEYSAREVAQILRKRGFDPYLAITDQTTRGLKENIFGQIKSSDYFLFIDFRRERLPEYAEAIYRGSLFSHQELAIASYLDLPILAFRQSGVAETEGMIGVLQVNALPFETYSELPALVEKSLSESNWDPTHQNLLMLQTCGYEDAVGPPDQPDNARRYFHIAVQNRNHIAVAKQCSGYITQILNEQTKEPLIYEQAEVKWAGIEFPTVNLLPQRSRKMDAIVIHKHEPHVGYFRILARSPTFRPQCEGPGNFLIEFSILSENFPPAVARFRLSLGLSIPETQFKLIE